MTKLEGYVSTAGAAKILGVSRVTVFKRIKKGEIKAEKVGRNFLIAKPALSSSLGASLSAEDKQQLSQGVKKVVKDYGETLRLLGKE